MGLDIVAFGKFGRSSQVDPSIPTVASGDSIDLHHLITRITGNTTINTINTPDDPNFNGPLYIYNTDSSVGATGTSGNIQLATTLTRYKVFALIKDVVANKWYPSATS